MIERLSRAYGSLPDPIRYAVDVTRRTIANFLNQEGIQWAGAVAFYLILSIPPLLIAGFSVAVVIVGEDTARTYLTDQIVQFLPAEEQVIRDVVGQTIGARGAASLVALAFLLFSGSRVFASLIAAINVMWSELPEPGFLRRQLTRLVMLVTVGALFATAGAIDLVVGVWGEELPLPAVLLILLRTQVLPALLAFSALLLLYRLVPRRAATWRTALVGALVGTILLRVAQAVFTAYLVTFGGFESAYGPIASAAVLMTWALVASGAVLLAAHLVAVLNADQGAKGPADPEKADEDYRAPGKAAGSAT